MDRTEEVGEMLTDMDSTGILSDWVDGGGGGRLRRIHLNVSITA